MVLSETRAGLALMWSPTCSRPDGAAAARGLQDPRGPRPHSPPSCWGFHFLPGTGVEEGVPMKTSRGRSGPIRWYAVFPLWDFGEVTEEVSGTQGPWKEVPQAIGSPIVWLWAAKLLSYPGAPGSATIFKMWPLAQSWELHC